jgi:hypothetical protein
LGCGAGGFGFGLGCGAGGFGFGVGLGAGGVGFGAGGIGFGFGAGGVGFGAGGVGVGFGAVGVGFGFGARGVGFGAGAGAGAGTCALGAWACTPLAEVPSSATAAGAVTWVVTTPGWETGAGLRTGATACAGDTAAPCDRASVRLRAAAVRVPVRPVRARMRRFKSVIATPIASLPSRAACPSEIVSRPSIDRSQRWPSRIAIAVSVARIVAKRSGRTRS